MSLKEYRKKRSFEDTPEPEDIYNNDNKFRFVIQRHRASHLHYDLRLEMEGVLKSWAIPKGPSLNSKDKRLALHTEDHPVAYLTFEGIIPKGNYGAGKMTIWDSGFYESLNMEKSLVNDYSDGKLKLIFHGKKVKGIFSLVRSSSTNKENQWLLIKHDDAFATVLNYNAEDYQPEKFSTAPKHTTASLNLKSVVKPMLASPAKQVFNNKHWIYELKYDGYRALAHVNHGDVSLYTRNGISIKDTFSIISEALKTLDHSAILDGEIVVQDAKGIPHFNALQHYNPKSTDGHLTYYIFDLLFLNGYSTLELPLLDRKQLLKELLPETSHLAYCDHVEGMGVTVYNQAISMGMEGIIAKKSNSKYYTNTRTTDWLKFKKIESTDAIICGYTLSKTRSRKFASLILGMINDNELEYVGTCGSGFSEEKIRELFDKFQALIIETPPFNIDSHLKGREAIWVRPQLVCEVKFTEWTPNEVMRHPVFLRLRHDKSIKSETSIVKKDPITRQPKGKEMWLEVNDFKVPITHIDKLYWPDAKLTKYDLLDYYIKMSEVVLPYLKDRPQSLLRHPNGINGNSFYQKDNDNLPDWIETTVIASKSSDKSINYLLCQNEATLLYLNNLGCIELHPWHSTIYQLNQPDYAIIDLDPSDNNTFEQVIETALLAKSILDTYNITGYCKTSGASGIHIYIPMGGNYTYNQVRYFTKLICMHIQNQLPNLTTLERVIKKRGPKIYLDYLQNRKGQTIASPYSLRSRSNATVSTPLEWHELKSGLKIEAFNIHTVPERMSNIEDPFKKILNKGIDMEEILDLML